MADEYADDPSSMLDEKTTADDSKHLVELYAPDKGARAWLCVTGSFLGIFCSFGYVNVIGVFQEYYASHQLQDYSQSSISWISSIETFIMVFGSIIVGRLYDMFGPFPLIMSGTAFMTVGVMTASVADKYYQFLLAQGFCTAIGASLIFSPSISAVSGWFIKRRALALGISAAGSSIGGVVMPIMFRQIETRSGFAWAMRALGFLMLACGIVATFTVNSRIRINGGQGLKIYDTYVTPFRSVKFCTTVAAVFFAYWGLFIPIGYVPSHAVAHGVSSSLALYMISILNGASFFGRLLPGFVADKIGRYVTFAAGIGLSSVLVLGLWIPAHTHAQIIAFAAAFGFTSGSVASIWPAMVAETSAVHQIGARIGLTSAVASFAALSGMPIAGAIVASDGGETYWAAAIFSGATLLIGAALALVAHKVRQSPQAKE
ncbi:major facilitator superfamily domain-containing protein [Lipomyces japonicus]|uniref:major facilitator superfamily domain-containing protein n=1 Tax=Lipomyces japonicus TaxID=56871 RepID=UPI0034CEB738